MLNVGSSATRGSSVSVGVDVSSGELVAISDWHSTSSAKHGTEPECQAEHDVDRQTQVLVIMNTCNLLSQLHLLGHCSYTRLSYDSHEISTR